MSNFWDYKEKHKEQDTFWDYDKQNNKQSDFWDYDKVNETKNNLYTSAVKDFPKDENGNIDQEAFKNNIDNLYDIPQTDIPHSDVYSNSDGKEVHYNGLPLQAKAEMWVEGQNNKVKEQARQNLQKRAEWEEKHPIISGIQKDYQLALGALPSYRGQVPQWELQAQYGLKPPIEEQLKADAKTFANNLVPATNISVDVLSGGEAAIAKGGIKKFIKEGIKNAVKAGGIGGVTQGITSSLADNGISKDALLRPLEYGAIGTGMGVPMGAIGGVIGRGLNQKARQKVIQELADKRKDWGIAFKSASGSPKRAIETLLKFKKGFVPKAFYKEGIGDIDLVWGKHDYNTGEGYGLEHIIARRKAQGIDTDQFLKEMPKTIKNGIVTTDPNFPTRKYIEDPNKKISVELSWNEKDRKWIVTAFKQNKSAGKRLMKNAPLSNITPENGTRSISGLTADSNIITDSAENLNPAGANTDFNQSKLKSTMQQAGTLPEELADKNIEYQILHNDDLKKSAQEAVNADANGVHNSLLKKISDSGDYKDYMLTANDIAEAKILAEKFYKEGKNTEAIELTEGIIKGASKTGQALQAYSLWSRTTPAGAVAYAQKLINRYNKTTDKKLSLKIKQIDAIKNLAENIQNTAEGTRDNQIAVAQLHKYIGDLFPKSWTKKFDSYRYSSMLLSGKSRIKDFLLTGLNAADSAIDETIANGIDKIRSIVTGKPKVYGGLQPKEWGKGFVKGFKEGAEDVKLGINTSRSGERGRYGLPKTPSFKYTPLSNIEKSPKGLLQVGENALATGEKALNYTLQVPDRAFYEGRFASSLASQMKAAGVEKPTQQMYEQAHKEALKAIFQDDSLLSKLGNKSREYINSVTEHLENEFKLQNGTLPRIGDFIEPFVTTPANILNNGLENLGGAIPGSIQLAMAKTPQEIRDAEMLIAKNIKGAVPLSVGTIIGNGTIESNIGQNDYQTNEVTGTKPHSIVIGDKSFSLKDYPQWDLPISAAAGFVQGGPSKAVSNVMEGIGEMSSLKAVGDTMDAFRPSYPGEEMTADKVASNLVRNQGTNVLSQLIPYGGELGELRNDIDSYSRELYVPKGDNTKEMINNTGKYIKNRLQNRLPIASTYLPPKYNAIGEPVMVNNIDNPLARVASEAIDFGVRNRTDDEAYKTMKDYHNVLKNENIRRKEAGEDEIERVNSVRLSRANRTQKINGKTYHLNNEEYSKFQKDYGKIHHNLIKDAFKNNRFSSTTSGEITKYLSELNNSALQAVKIMQLGDKPQRMHDYTDVILRDYEKWTK